MQRCVTCAVIREGYSKEAELPGGSLGAAILMQTERHQRFHDLEVRADFAAGTGEMSGRVASQAFYIVVEALSNIVKHTTSRRGFVEVESRKGALCVRVGNEQASDSPASPDFIPKSIKSRVEALGGSLEIQQGAQGYTVVRAIIPA